MSDFRGFRVGCFLVVSSALGCASTTPAPKVAPPSQYAVETQIVTPKVDGTPRELFAKGEAALAAKSWREAVDAFEGLLAGDPDGPYAPQALMDLATAHEALGERTQARDRYHELTQRFPKSTLVRAALTSAASLHAYLEEWPQLVSTANEMLARKDLDDVDRMTALGARGLGEVEQHQLDPASRDVQDGLDIVEQDHYGALNRLPVPAAQLRFALGELRRARSEEVSLDPPGPDFVLKIELRCNLLLSAQNAYADAIRSVDPHWAAMSGYRVGEMYRELHKELMAIPPVAAAKTERQKQLHYGIMHLRYRALLEKGMEMMRRTVALGEKTGDTSTWQRRAEEAKAEMELALEEERTQLAKLPFSEAELQAAMDVLQKEAIARQEKEQKRQEAKAARAK